MVQAKYCEAMCRLVIVEYSQVMYLLGKVLSSVVIALCGFVS